MYTVPIIANDLRHEETIIQAAYALNTLQQTIDNVFQRLDTRIAANSAKVKDIGMRIQSADQRIRSLVGVKKSVQILAPARYPAAHVLCDSKVSFKLQAEKEPVNDNYEIKNRFESLHPDSRHEKLVFFHLNSANNVAALKAGDLPEHITATRIKLNNLGHTLGEAPENLRSITSLLRFNSEEEAYNRQMANEQSAMRPDSWRRAKVPKSQQKAEKKILEPAPHSLANRNQRAQPAGDLRYMPKMHEAPIIDLPMDLPSLEGIAQDIHFVGNLPTKIENDLPRQQKEKEKEREFSSEVLNTITTIKVIPKPSTTPQVVTTTPPPPPPPPPPPQPALMAATTKVIESKAEAQAKALPAAASDTRSALMDAIRQAGGARGGRLRAAAAAPVDVTDNRKTAPASSGNLMEDLHNKLLMRRKGISGSSSIMSGNTNNLGSGNPVLQRLSALIPPPPSKSADNDDATSNANADDGDWE